MKKIFPVKAALMAGTGVLTACTVQEAPVNFIVIHLDDMGYGDLTVTGASGYSTPNIDRLCTEGMRFTNWYSAQAVSSASRAGLLTGCYPNRIGFAGALGPGAETGISDEEETIAEVVSHRGYRNIAIGKWHLGDREQFLPLNHGFDEYFGLPYSNDMWPYNPNSTRKTPHPPLPLIEGFAVVNPDVKPSDQQQLTTLYTERAVRFIKENRKSPFFIYLAHSMPHVPLYVSDKFRGKSAQGLYGDVMMELDWSVGQIMEALREAGLDSRTLVVFTSDNGPWINYGNHAGSTGGLREGKGTTFEGGQRVPCIMRWPGRIPAGTVNNQLASSIDLLPTFAHISGARLPEKRIDGVNILSLMEGETSASPREYFLYYYRKNNLEAIRNERFKLVFEHEAQSYEGVLPGNDGVHGRGRRGVLFPKALYDMRRDPGERYDVQTQHPEVMTRLEAAAERAREDLGDDLTGRPGTGRRAVGRLR